jgi:hypothetical protein
VQRVLVEGMVEGMVHSTAERRAADLSGYFTTALVPVGVASPQHLSCRNAARPAASAPCPRAALQVVMRRLQAAPCTQCLHH